MPGVQTITVIGAGIMGRGIAHAAALGVRMDEMRPEAHADGKGVAERQRFKCKPGGRE